MNNSEKSTWHDTKEVNKTQLGLNDEQFDQWANLLDADMSSWPEDLKNEMELVSKKIGMSGDVAAEVTALYVKGEKYSEKLENI